MIPAGPTICLGRSRSALLGREDRPSGAVDQCPIGIAVKLLDMKRKEYLPWK